MEDNWIANLDGEVTALEQRIDARLDAARAWKMDYWGGCPNCLQNDGYMNIGRTHIFVCHNHRLSWEIGANLFSSWRHESEVEWLKNAELLHAYTEVEPLRNPIFNGHADACPGCGARDGETHHPICRRQNGMPTSIPSHIVRSLLEAETPREILQALIIADENFATSTEPELGSNDIPW